MKKNVLLFILFGFFFQTVLLAQTEPEDIALAKDDFQNALNYYIKALNINPKYSSVFENRGICYYNLGFYKLAAADFESAMKYNPELKEKLMPLYVDAKSR